MLRENRPPHLDMCLGLVEQPQRGMPGAVWFQGDEGLQPLHAQAEMCSSAKRGNTGDNTPESGDGSLIFIRLEPFLQSSFTAVILATFDQIEHCC